MALREGRPLSPMERQVAQLVADGRTDAEAAAELGLSERTVGWHAARAARKLGARSRIELAAAFVRHFDSPGGAS